MFVKGRTFFIIEVMIVMRIGFFVLIATLLSPGRAYAARCAELLDAVILQTRESKREVTLQRGEIVEIKGRTKTKARYLIATGEETAFVLAASVKVLPAGQACGMGDPAKQQGEGQQQSSVNPQASHAKSKFWQGVRFGVQAGVRRGGSGKDFEDLETDIPDAGNVGQLQDPIILDVKPESGYWLRAFAEKPVTGLLWARSGFTYRQTTYSYTAKANPTLGAVTLDSLASSDHEFNRRQLRVDGSMGLRHPLNPSWSLGYGLEIALLYNLDDDEKIDVLVPTGAFFKNTPATVSGGPSKIDYEAILVGDVRWRNLSFALGYGFDGMLTASLAYLF